MGPMSKIQTKNISTLCSELGFSEDSPGRDQRTFTNIVTEFRKRFIEKGNHLPYGAADSPEAQHFALAFCQEQNRGATLWPSTLNNSWPAWSSDRAKILEPLAHIFALQAFHQYQYNLKREKKKMPSATPTLSPDRDTRGLSPESLKIIDATPIPPSGTRRRPAKSSGVVTEPVLENNEEQICDNCISEACSLDPRQDDKPVIAELTAEWLSKTGARWPVAADIRIRAYMHDNSIYNPDAPDIKIIPLLNSLKKGTNIEECKAEQWNTLQERTMNRIEDFARDMVEKGLLKKKDGTLQKIDLFKDVWVGRRGRYGPPKESVSKTTTMAKSRDVYSTDNLPPDQGPGFRTSTAKLMSTVRQPFSTTTPIGTRRKLDATNESAASNQPKQKKRRMSMMSTRTQAIIPPPLGQNAALPSVAEALREDSVTAENIEFALETLSSDNEQEPQQATRVPPRMQSANKDTRPMTPTSPALVSNSFQRASKPVAVSEGAAPTPSFDTISTAAASPGQRTPQTGASLRAEQHQALSANPPPALILEKADGSFDEDDPLPSAHFRNSTVNEFFSFVSEATGRPRDSFDRLTFTFLFVRSGDSVRLIHEGDDTAWNKLKSKTKFLCDLYRRKTEESELQLVVEFGDKRNMSEG